MKIPRFVNPSAIEAYTNLPAVATVVAGGFCSQAAAVARFGDAKTAHTYILLDYTARHRIADCVKLSAIHEHIPSDLDRHAIRRCDGAPGAWFNGESLWISVEWLRMVRGLAGDLNVGARLAFSLLDALA